MDDQKRALTDTGLHLRLASDQLERSQQQAADYIVAIVRTPLAQDALDRPVATSLTASGSKVTMTVLPEATSA